MLILKLMAIKYGFNIFTHIYQFIFIATTPAATRKMFNYSISIIFTLNLFNNIEQ